MPLQLTPGERMVVATHNPGKAREIAELLDGRFDLVTAGDLRLDEPEETESTFAGNALLKARAAAEASGLIALADDSGLSVAALSGAPGIYSARWAGPDKDFAAAMARVRAELAGGALSRPAAWFTCALAVVWPGGAGVVVEGRIDGALAFPPRGDRGFGYDPIFLPEGGELTFGEMDPAAKDAISHRARAFAKLKAALFSTLPLAVYVHWPYCARICPYCDFNVVRDRGRHEEQAQLVDAIIADLEGHARLTGPRRLVSVFFGGGTPSLMAPAAIARVVERARALWTPSAGLEVSLEANPADAAGFTALAEAGVSRLSLGAQSFDDVALCFLGRDHSASDALRAIAAARTAVSRVSIDLIYARPGQGSRAWTAELRRALALGVEHISPYQLTIEAGTAFDRAVRRGAMTPADPELAADLYEVTQEVLSGAGFDAYEVSNHARGPAARSRHNLAYWRGEDYVGAGPGAHGRLAIDGVRTATEAARGIGDYLAAVHSRGVGWASSEPMSPLEAAEERLLMGLRTIEGVAFADLTPLGLTADDPTVVSLEEQGFITAGVETLHVTRKGRPVLDRLTLELASATRMQPA